MSKSVLVMETPENCDLCKIGQDHSISLETCIYCPIEKRLVIDKETETIPDWCPLKPLPEEDYEDHYPDEWEDGYADGWNACLREITGQPKEDY